MVDFFRVENDGPEIVSTNYWESEYCKGGAVYLTTNAGCFRLLVADGMPIHEMENCEMVIITRGPWPARGQSDGIEILFEDGSEEPYCLHIAPSQQCDRVPLDKDVDKPGRDPKWKFAAYHMGRKVFEKPVRYRTAKKIPHLKPWG